MSVEKYIEPNVDLNDFPYLPPIFTIAYSPCRNAVKMKIKIFVVFNAWLIGLIRIPIIMLMVWAFLKPSVHIYAYKCIV